MSFANFRERARASSIIGPLFKKQQLTKAINFLPGTEREDVSNGVCVFLKTVKAVKKEEKEEKEKEEEEKKGNNKSRVQQQKEKKFKYLNKSSSSEKR